MTEQVYGLFARIDDAERAISALKDHGAGGNEISVIRRSDGAGLPRVEEGGSHGFTTTTADDVAAGAAKGGAAGLALGILAGAVALVVPGIGPILAAGPLATAFGAALIAGAAGAVGGGAIGYLVDQGVPAERAEIYHAALNRGDILVAVRSAHLSASDAVMLMEKYGATEIGRHLVGAPVDGAVEPPVVDRTMDELEGLDEDVHRPAGVVPAVPPIATGQPGLPGPIGR